MHDPTAWENPDELRPGQFLDSAGKLCLKKDISLLFGAGKTFARHMFFMRDRIFASVHHSNGGQNETTKIQREYDRLNSHTERSLNRSTER